ncbi:hypothetical protein FJTKL_10403 [Diaporthe vaccinii]|uniref:Uncharacterized protein n=1 Tax=Diaporthe vaccinii TaxID=105482 RepID=A0ABR4EK67_9PEZI
MGKQHPSPIFCPRTKTCLLFPLLPLHTHTTRLLYSTHHPSHSHTCAGSFPIHHHDCLKAHSSLLNPPLLRIDRGLPQNTAPAPSRPPRLNSSQPRHSRSLLPTSTVIPPRSHSPSHRRPSLRSPLPLRSATVNSDEPPIGVASRPLWSRRREPTPNNPRLSTRHRSCLCISTTKFPSTDTPTLPSSYSSFATRGSLVAPIPAPTVEQDRQHALDAFMFMPTHQPNIQVCPMLKQSPVYH